MPELPEVETVRRILERAAVGKTIVIEPRPTVTRPRIVAPA